MTGGLNDYVHVPIEEADDDEDVIVDQGMPLNVDVSIRMDRNACARSSSLVVSDAEK